MFAHTYWQECSSSSDAGPIEDSDSVKHKRDMRVLASIGQKMEDRHMDSDYSEPEYENPLPTVYNTLPSNLISHSRCLFLFIFA